MIEENFKAYGLVKAQYEAGKIDMLDLLAVQSKWVQARIAIVDVQSQRLLNRTGLHLALGGSFE